MFKLIKNLKFLGEESVYKLPFRFGKTECVVKGHFVCFLLSRDSIFQNPHFIKLLRNGTFKFEIRRF